MAPLSFSETLARNGTEDDGLTTCEKLWGPTWLSRGRSSKGFLMLLTRSLKVSDDWTCQTSYTQKRANNLFFPLRVLLLLLYTCNSKENLGRPLSSKGWRQTYCCELAAISRQERERERERKKRTFHEPIIVSFGAEEEIKIKSRSYY